jgi:hypothetical protein
LLDEDENSLGVCVVEGSKKPFFHMPTQYLLVSRVRVGLACPAVFSLQSEWSPLRRKPSGKGKRFLLLRKVIN